MDCRPMHMIMTLGIFHSAPSCNQIKVHQRCTIVLLIRRCHSQRERSRFNSSPCRNGNEHMFQNDTTPSLLEKVLNVKWIPGPVQ